MPPRLSFRDFALGIALLLICLFFAAASPQFLSSRNLSYLLIELSVTAILALGMLLVILPGHIDLSAGSGVGLIGGVAAVLVSGGEVAVQVLSYLRRGMSALAGPQASEWIALPPWNPPAAMLAALILALVLWGLMGTLIVREGIPAFIVTLGGLLIFKGLFWLTIQSHTIPVNPANFGPPITLVTYLHLGDWRAPVWELARETSGAFDLSLLLGGHAFHVLQGTGNLYSILTTSYLTPTAGYGLAGLVVAVLFLTRWRRGGAGEAQDDAHAADGEVSFLQVFLAAQLIFLAVIVTNQFRGMPLPAVILAAVATAVWVLTQQTPFGRYLYAVGGNEEAALISGVPVRLVSIGAFVLMGGIVAITGFMQTAYGGSSTTTVGDLMELDAVAACVIGGVSLKGGRGTVLGVLFGALIMAALINGMTMLAVRPEMKFVVRGAVLILAVWMDRRLAR